jgi:hypothetical protein
MFVVSFFTTNSPISMVSVYHHATKFNICGNLRASFWQSKTGPNWPQWAGSGSFFQIQILERTMGVHSHSQIGSWVVANLPDLRTLHDSTSLDALHSFNNILRGIFNLKNILLSYPGLTYFRF